MKHIYTLYCMKSSMLGQSLIIYLLFFVQKFSDDLCEKDGFEKIMVFPPKTNVVSNM